MKSVILLVYFILQELPHIMFHHQYSELMAYHFQYILNCHTLFLYLILIQPLAYIIFNIFILISTFSDLMQIHYFIFLIFVFFRYFMHLIILIFLNVHLIFSFLNLIFVFFFTIMICFKVSFYKFLRMK